MSLLYTFNEFDQKSCFSFRILGFRIFFAYRKPTKTPIPEDTKLVFLLTKQLLLSTLG